jgi:hypothetical protein
MRQPDAVKHHPNATFVLSTTPLTTILAWAILQLGVSMPQAVAAAFGTLISGGLLIFRTAIQRTGGAIWDLGISGCCRRLWKGNQSPPAV